MTDLANKTCVPCKGDTPPLQSEEIKSLRQQIP
jgi:hypothetical protein